MKRAWLWPIALSVVVLLWWWMPKPVIMAQDSPELPNAELRFGRVVEDQLELLTDPNGMAVAELQRGTEFEVLETEVQRRDQRVWYHIARLTDEEQGWVAAEAVELALPGSTITLRRYEGGVCIATPIDAERLTDIDILSGYQHRLLFDADELQVDQLSDWYLIFNGQVRDLDVRADRPANGLLLPAFWVLRHSGFAPRWSAETYWQLQWQCEDSAE